MNNLCPCYSGQPYADCCQPLHHGLPAPNAERLMRSRYSAYVFKIPEYLLHTWHPQTRPTAFGVEALNGMKWLKLEVVAHVQTDQTHACVQFIATYQHGRQKKTVLEEYSRFECVDGQWLYLDDQGLLASTLAYRIGN